jgi:hypothetical protein
MSDSCFTSTLVHADGSQHHVALAERQLLEYIKSGNPVAAINREYAKGVDLSLGTPFEQMKAAAGLIRPSKNDPFGLRPALIGDVLSGKSFANVQQQTSPFGTASKYFVNVAVISEILSEVQKDRMTDAATFDGAVGQELTVDQNHFEQPVIVMNTLGGPEQAKASRVSQGATPPKMLVIGTAERVRTIGAWNIGITFTDQMMQNFTLDAAALTIGQYLKVERDERVYRYINDLFLGGSDMITTTVPTSTSTSYDPLSTGGVLTHKAWLLFLAARRKFGNMTHVFLTPKTYVQVEGRTGRPGSNNYDPTLPRIDPNVTPANTAQIGFGNNIQYVIVDPVTDGGPIPDGECWFLNKNTAVTRVTNTAAAYQATVRDELARTSALRIDWAEEVFRTFGDTELSPFRRLVIA